MGSHPGRTVLEHLADSTEPPISFEIIPPLRGANMADLTKLVERLARHHPRFIDVTSHASEVAYDRHEDGNYTKRTVKKRPGTLGLCTLIRHQYSIDPVPHILCSGFTRDETEDLLLEAQFSGIRSVLAIRGDSNGVHKTSEGKTMNHRARDLVKQINAMNRGDYLHNLKANPLDMCIGVAGYPEKHFEAPNNETDIAFLKEKIDAGASYIVTQMCFDAPKYTSFVERCRAAGIAVPIVPGLKVITSAKQMYYLPGKFHVEIPYELTRAMHAASSDEQVREIGIAWAANQMKDLLRRGAPVVHMYVMQNADVVDEVIKRAAA